MTRIAFLVSVLVMVAAASLPAWALGRPGEAAGALHAGAVVQPPAGQAPPAQATPQTPPKPTRPSTRPPAAGRQAMLVFVNDSTGAPISGALVRLDGPIMREGHTTREGSVRFQGLRPGAYRLRMQADGFITLEKDVTVRGGGVTELEASLSKAPEPPKAVEPPPAPKSAPHATGAGSLPPADPNATVEVVSVVDWLAKNRLERGEPRKEAVVARGASESASMLQVRDALRDRSHADADEVIYVINGAAALSSKGRVQTIETGALVLVPRGVVFTLENRGREPLWALSVLSPAGERPRP